MSLRFLSTLIPASPAQTASLLNSTSPGSPITSSFLSKLDIQYPSPLSFVLTLALTLIPLSILHFRSYLSSSKSRTLSPDALPSYFYPAVTTHGRHLPLTAKNSFSYAVLYAAVDIDSLEAGHLNLPFRVFNYGGDPRLKLIGLRSHWYLETGDHSFREKLENVLEAKGIPRDHVGKTWFLTMPCMLGWEGQNPLSTFYVYKKGSRELLCFILEVHSSFGESHLYVLKPGSPVAHEPAQGYDYAFTFPRSFHVSPFNSRDSCYRVDLVNPFPESFDKATSVPKFKIHTRVLTPDGEVKLNATLNTAPAPPVAFEPWSTFAVLRTLAKWPLTLLLVQTRTNYQAYILHYKKRLALYVRPETITEGDEALYNPPGTDPHGVGAVMQRNEATWVEAKAKDVVHAWAKRRAEEIGVDLEIVYRHTNEIFSTDGTEAKSETDSNADGKREKLVIHTADSHFHTNLIVAPTPHHHLIIATEKLTSVSSPPLFIAFFAPPSEPVTGLLTSLASTWRNKYYTRLFSHSTYSPPPSLPKLQVQTAHFTSSPLLTRGERWAAARITFWFVLGQMAEEDVFELIKARYVPGQEPWMIWDRSMQRAWGTYSNEGDVNGSVLLDQDRKEIVRGRA